MSRRFAWSGRVVVAVALGFSQLAVAADPPPPEDVQVEWVKGPTQVDVGDTLAEIKLPDGLAFAGAADARRLLEQMGNLTDGSEQGIIVPRAQDQDWFIVLEWNPIGFVKDDEKDSIDAPALLKSISEATEESNAERKKRGRPGLHVVGWAEPPRYDPVTHNLTWALLGRNDEGGESINYNVRVLGRSGVMSVTLVDSPRNLARAKPAVDSVISGFGYKQGKRYAEWVPGDKVAEYGLTALVAAGAGAAAVKLGLLGVLAKLFAKAGKLVIVALAGVGALGVKLWNALRGKASARPEQPPAGGA